MCFNPRTHEGCDLKVFPIFFLPITFQSTHPRGVRLVAPCSHNGCKQFQSTHPRGVRRNGAEGRSREGHVSIHAPTRGATSSRTIRMTTAVCFNPRTHEGCDIWFGLLICHCSCFNPRTHEGCDTLFGEIVKEPQGFNPRTHEGCDFCPLF